MAITRQDLIDLLGRTTDPNWLDGMMSNADSLAVLNGLFDICVELGGVVEDGTNTGYISAAPGGTPGTTILTLYRNDTTNSIFLPYTSVFFRTITGNTKLQLIQNMSIPVGESTSHLYLQTARQTEAINTGLINAYSDQDDRYDDDPSISIAATELADSSCQSILDSGGNIVLTAPDAISPADPDFQLYYEGSTPIINGASDWLSVLGNERGQQRQANEDTGLYRARIRNIINSVCPTGVIGALRGTTNRIAVNLGPIFLLEPYNDEADEETRYNVGLSEMAPYYCTGTLPATGSPKIDFWDDSFLAGPITPVVPVASQYAFDTAVDPVIKELVDARQCRAYFKVFTSPYIVSAEAGQIYNSEISFGTFTGYDPLLPGANLQITGYKDAQHDSIDTAGMVVYEEANRRRAGGVQFDLIFPLEKLVVAKGNVTNGTDTIALTLTPPSGKVWKIVNGVASHDAMQSATVPNQAQDSHKVKFYFTSGSPFTTTLFSKTHCESITTKLLQAQGFDFTKKINKIEGLITSAGSRNITMVLEARVFEIDE